MGILMSNTIIDALAGARARRDEAGRSEQGRLWALVVTELEGALLRCLVAEGDVTL